jgi:hypothetical protein
MVKYCIRAVGVLQGDGGIIEIKTLEIMDEKFPKSVTP